CGGDAEARLCVKSAGAVFQEEHTCPAAAVLTVFLSRDRKNRKPICFCRSMTAIDNERQARNLKALLGVAKALASEIKLDNLLQVIVAKAAEVMDAERATLFLYDKPRNELWSKTTQKLEIN